MKAVVSRFLVIALCALAGACDSSTGPTPAGYVGQWSGTTAQGRPIAFTISPEEVVTTITLGHDFNGCSGSQTFSNLSLSTGPRVDCIPGPCPPSMLPYRGFDYTSGNPIDEPSTNVNAVFSSTAKAEGTVNFRSFPGCGHAIAVAWTATKP